MNEKNLTLFNQNIKQYYKKKGILIFPIIDHINIFLKMKKKWKKFLIEKKKLLDKNS